MAPEALACQRSCFGIGGQAVWAAGAPPQPLPCRVHGRHPAARACLRIAARRSACVARCSARSAARPHPEQGRARPQRPGGRRRAAQEAAPEACVAMFWDGGFDARVRGVSAAINAAYAARHGYAFHGEALPPGYAHQRDLRATKFGLILRLLRGGRCPYVLFLDADAHVRPQKQMS